MRVGILLYHHVSELEAVGAYAVFSAARALMDDPEALEVFTVAKSRNSVQTVAEMTITPTWAFASAPPVTGLVVPGGPGAEAASRDRAVRRYLEPLRGSLEFVASVGSGALVLGEGGFLASKSVTTAPYLREKLEDYEVLRVGAERVLRGEGGLWSASGGAAALELALALLRERFGEVLVGRVAERLDLSPQRR